MTNSSNLTPTNPPQPATLAVDTEDDKKRLRQQERTVDNLNRLFAMLFSIVFAIAAATLTQKFIDFAINKSPRPIKVDPQIAFFNIGCLFILATTAAVFFHQASRSLDLTYSSSPQLKPHPGALAVDFGVIAATMVPFVLMARSLDKIVTDSSGFFFFFFAHEMLIMFGLIWVVVRLVRFRIYHPESVSETFRNVGTGVERFWLFMNSGYILLTSIIFSFISGSFTHNPACPLIPHHNKAILFITTFFILATIRNCADYFTLFNVFFPIKPAGINGEQIYRFPLRRCIEARPIKYLLVTWPEVFGISFFLASYYIIFHVTKLYDLGRWTKLCDGSIY